MKASSLFFTTVLASSLVNAASPLFYEATTIYNPTTDFSIQNGNPNGVWSYGVMPTDFSTFTLDNQIFQPGDNFYGNAIFASYWAGEIADPSPPHIWLNTTTSTVYGIAPGQLSLHPGGATEPSVLRWTSPSNGSCTINGQFFPGHYGRMSLGIRKSTAWLWQGTDSGVFNNLIVPVTIGDTIDFLVYGGYIAGNTPIDLTISCDWGMIKQSALSASVERVNSQSGSITCTNLTTGNAKIIKVRKGVVTWNCETAGLVVNKGDKIQKFKLKQL